MKISLYLHPHQDLGDFVRNHPVLRIPLLYVSGRHTAWIGAKPDSRQLPIDRVDSFVYGLMELVSPEYVSYRDVGHYLTDSGCYGVYVFTDKPGIYGTDFMHITVEIE